MSMPKIVRVGTQGVLLTEGEWKRLLDERDALKAEVERLKGENKRLVAEVMEVVEGECERAEERDKARDQVAALQIEIKVVRRTALEEAARYVEIEWEQWVRRSGLPDAIRALATEPEPKGDGGSPAAAMAEALRQKVAEEQPGATRTHCRHGHGLQSSDEHHELYGCSVPTCMGLDSLTKPRTEGET